MNVVGALTALAAGAFLVAFIGTIDASIEGDKRRKGIYLKVFILSVVLFSLALGFGTGTEGCIK